MEKIRVALVEDDAQVREGLELLTANSDHCRCVAAFESAERALYAFPDLDPDVVLMDIHLPGMSGIDCIRELKRRRPKIQIMMLTVFEDHDRIFKSLAVGASGYLLKQTPLPGFWKRLWNFIMVDRQCLRKSPGMSWKLFIGPWRKKIRPQSLALTRMDPGVLMRMDPPAVAALGREAFLFQGGTPKENPLPRLDGGEPFR